MVDQRGEKQHDEDNEENLRDLRGPSRDAAESKNGGDDRYDEKRQCPAKHLPPPRLRRHKPRRRLAQCPQSSQIRIRTGIGTPKIHSSRYLMVGSFGMSLANCANPAREL